MNIKIIEFYPIERDDNRKLLSGTLQVRLPDLGLCILGIVVSKRKDAWFFHLPSKSGTHHVTGEKVRYPIIAFEDHTQHKALIDTIREKGRTFIEDYLKANPVSLNREIDNIGSLTYGCTGKLNSEPLTQEKRQLQNQQPTKKKAFTKVWKDPPKMKKAKC